MIIHGYEKVESGFMLFATHVVEIFMSNYVLSGVWEVDNRLCLRRLNSYIK